MCFPSNRWAEGADGCPRPGTLAAAQSDTGAPGWSAAATLQITNNKAATGASNRIRDERNPKPSLHCDRSDRP